MVAKLAKINSLKVVFHWASPQTPSKTLWSISVKNLGWGVEDRDLCVWRWSLDNATASHLVLLLNVEHYKMKDGRKECALQREKWRRAPHGQREQANKQKIEKRFVAYCQYFLEREIINIRFPLQQRLQTNAGSVGGGWRWGVHSFKVCHWWGLLGCWSCGQCPWLQHVWIGPERSNCISHFT